MQPELSTDMKDPDAIPYFTWDDPMTVAQIHERLRTASEAERFRLLGKILREANDRDVWNFTTPQYVADNWDQIERNVGRRRPFWIWLLGKWGEHGLIRR